MQLSGVYCLEKLEEQKIFWSLRTGDQRRSAFKKINIQWNFFFALLNLVAATDIQIQIFSR